MHNHTTDEVKESLRPITSLINKSEKALQKLKPGTWQHTMLRDNLKALQCASVLMSKDTGNTDNFTRDELLEVLRVLTSIIERVEKSQVKFLPGTSQHALQRNRLKALRIAASLVTKSFREKDRKFGRVVKKR